MLYLGYNTWITYIYSKVNKITMNRIVYFVMVILFATSCKQAENPKEQFLKWVQKGVIIDNVACKKDASQSYCLYLPVNYDITRSYPIIYAFDPHGKGRIPVALMKKSAERLGFIIVGSNNSKNGLSEVEINVIASGLLSDTKLKLSIDTNRIYTAGFSGGARVAGMVAQGIRGVKGVIACSAGCQSDGKPIGFDFICIAGTQDMNYFEVKQFSNYLKSSNQPNQLLVFKGKHQWPPESTLAEAIDLLNLYAMKGSLIEKNKSFVDEYLQNSSRKITKLRNSNSADSLAKAYNLLSQNMELLDGLTDIKELKSSMDELANNAILKKYLDEQTLLESYESDKQKEFVSSFSIKPEAWWNGEIAKLTETSKSVKSNLKSDVSMRLMGFISLNCYGYVNSALHYQDWKTAKYFASIYQKVDPENPDCWYALACIQANTGKPNDALASVKNALKFGYTDYSKLKNDPLLIRLRGLDEFNAIIKR